MNFYCNILKLIYVYQLPDGQEQKGGEILFPAHVPQLVDVVVQVEH